MGSFRNAGMSERWACLSDSSDKGDKQNGRGQDERTKDRLINDPYSHDSTRREFPLSQITFQPCNFLIPIQKVIKRSTGES